jgi:fluoride exporter
LILGWQAWLCVALGAGLGGALRYGVSGWIANRFGESFPWGTLTVNVSGAFVLGLLVRPLLDAPALYWWLLVTGLLGSYTTVSSFSLQTLNLLRDSQSARAVGNVLGTLAACLLAVAAGLAIGGAW